MTTGIAVITLWMLFLAWFGAVHRRRPPRDRLEAWYHQQLPGSWRWTPDAWKMAADTSLSKSRERRGLV